MQPGSFNVAVVAPCRFELSAQVSSLRSALFQVNYRGIVIALGECISAFAGNDIGGSGPPAAYSSPLNVRAIESRTGFAQGIRAWMLQPTKHDRHRAPHLPMSQRGKFYACFSSACGTPDPDAGRSSTHMLRQRTVNEISCSIACSTKERATLNFDPHV